MTVESFATMRTQIALLTLLLLVPAFTTHAAAEVAPLAASINMAGNGGLAHLGGLGFQGSAEYLALSANSSKKRIFFFSEASRSELP
jgi:hypothetical protein